MSSPYLSPSSPPSMHPLFALLYIISLTPSLHVTLSFIRRPPILLLFQYFHAQLPFFFSFFFFCFIFLPPSPLIQQEELTLSQLFSNRTQPSRDNLLESGARSVLFMRLKLAFLITLCTRIIKPWIIYYFKKQSRACAEEIWSQQTTNWPLESSFDLTKFCSMMFHLFPWWPTVMLT